LSREVFLYIHYLDVVIYYGMEYSIKTPNKQKLINECVKLHKQGLNREQIAKILGICSLTVLRYQYAGGLTFDSSKSPNKIIQSKLKLNA